MQTTAQVAGTVCLLGSGVQVGYGVLAVLFPFPAITEPGFEAVWAVANVGMIGGVVGWLALQLGRPRLLAVIGGGLAITGYVARIVISVVLIANPSAPVDAAIVGTIVLMFGGMIMLGVSTLRGRQLAGWQAWAPLLTVVTGLVAAAFYPNDKVVHFALLGLLWGPAWMHLGYVVRTRAHATTHEQSVIAEQSASPRF